MSTFQPPHDYLRREQEALDGIDQQVRVEAERDQALSLMSAAVEGKATAERRLRYVCDERDNWKRIAADHEAELERHSTDRVNQRSEVASLQAELADALTKYQATLEARDVWERNHKEHCAEVIALQAELDAANKRVETAIANAQTINGFWAVDIKRLGVLEDELAAIKGRREWGMWGNGISPEAAIVGPDRQAVVERMAHWKHLNAVMVYRYAAGPWETPDE